MKGLMKAFLCSILVSVIFLTLMACGKGETQGNSAASDEPVVLKLGTKMPDTSPEGKAFQRFADLVKEKSGGKLTVDVYPAEQLGKGTTQIDNMLMGTQDMYAEGATYFADYDSRLNITSVPYLFRDYEHFQKVFTGEIGQEIHNTLISKGMRVLNTEHSFVRGPYRVLLSTKPIQSLEDIKGLKLRAFESDVYVDAWKHLGASPTIIAWTETYLALKQHVVDAVTSPISLVKSMNFAEVAPYMTVIDEYPQDVVIVINEKKFQSLSPEFQNILVEAANEAGEYAAELVYEAADADIESMKTENNLQIIEFDKEPLVAKMKPFFYKLEEAGKLPEGMVDKILSIK